MPPLNVYDLAYRSLLAASLPVRFARAGLRAKALDWTDARDGTVAVREGSEPCVLVHAVSVGEFNAARALVDRLRSRRPDVHVVVTTGTLTGFAEAQKRYAATPGVTVARFPNDLSPSVERFLNAVRPDVAVLMEQETWPNFVLACSRRGVPVVVANGRISKTGFRNLRLARPFVAKTFARLDRVLVQEQAYADRYAYVGVPRDRIDVVGTMKFDSAPTEPTIAGAEQLAQEMGIDPNAPLWICGSTGDGEEAMVLDAYESIRAKHPHLQLAIIPRHPPRFDEVATLIESRGHACVRRSKPSSLVPRTSPLFLGDTMGELRKFYSLATVVFVGRSLVDLGPKQHGSDMIEPAALAKPVVVGPFTANFAEPMNVFRKAGAIVEVRTSADLAAQVSALLSDPARRNDLGTRARQAVHANRGATERHVEVILQLLKPALIR
jgi:3-deoxy-D-manno-octulosonic-acid transferase